MGLVSQGLVTRGKASHGQFAKHTLGTEEVGVSISNNLTPKCSIFVALLDVEIPSRTSLISPLTWQVIVTRLMST